MKILGVLHTFRHDRITNTTVHNVYAIRSDGSHKIMCFWWTYENMNNTSLFIETAYQ